jgi:riboflavin kinase/FMN adenylyltransferase
VATQLIRGLYNIRPAHRGGVLTMGNFDGMHLGHQALLKKVEEQARLFHAPALVMTFEPQPREFFSTEKAVPRLMRFQEKFYALSHTGIDYLLVMRFDAVFSHMSAEEFAQKVLHEKLGVKHIIVGDDFHFGAGRRGDFAFLEEAGKTYGFSAERMPSVTAQGERVSSTRIRLALQEDNHALAEALLGHAYTMIGRVVHGDKWGRRMGFPTANINVHRQMTPVQGIYVVRMHGISDHALPGVANVGIRPTVGGTRTLLEVHLFDFDENIYGKKVCVEFCKKLREEKKFESVELLIEQMWKDADMARDYFSKWGTR